MEFGFGVPELRPELFLQEGKVIRMGVPPVRLGILTSIDGVDFAACHARCVIGHLDGVIIPFIRREDLATNKKAAGRPQDLADLAELE